MAGDRAPAVECRGLTKDYGAGRGLFDLDLRVKPGDVFGFLGPNGAGKTTTIRLLMDLHRPTAGSARVFGLDCTRDSVAVKRLIGYLPGELPAFGGLRGVEVVETLASLRGTVDRVRLTALAERLGLDLGVPYRQYSRGNKQKLGLVLAFLHRPRLLILDEPTGGLDPLNQQVFYEMVEESRLAGATVFLSSHVLSEVEHVCNRIAIIREGRLVRAASLADLRRMRVHRVDVEFSGHVPEQTVRTAAGVSDVERLGQRLRFTVTGSIQRDFPAIGPRLARSRSSACLAPSCSAPVRWW